MINAFRGKYDFLSNFYVGVNPIYTSSGLPGKTLEHAYQAEKAQDKLDQLMVLAAETPAKAKEAGRRVQLSPNWEYDKVDIMARLLQQKFADDPDLRARLLATGDDELVEGNTWGDMFWGVDLKPNSKTFGYGANMLGILLMDLREDLRSTY